MDSSTIYSIITKFLLDGADLNTKQVLEVHLTAHSFVYQQVFTEGQPCVCNCGGNKDEKQVVPAPQEFVTGWEYICVIKATELFHLGNETSYPGVNRALTKGQI